MNGKKQIKRTWGIGIVCVVLLAVFVAGLFFMRMRNGVKIRAHNEFEIVNDFDRYRQDDEAWAEDRLGDSEYAMASSGCLVTCIASAMSSCGIELDLGEMNRLFSDNNVYDEAGNLLWENLNKLDNFGVDVFPQVEENSYIYLDRCLQGGWCPIVRVRMYGIGNFHYVWIVGAEDREYLCMAPLKDELTKLSEYGDRIYALRAYGMGRRNRLSAY